MKFRWFDTSAVKAFALEFAAEVEHARAAAVARGEKSAQLEKRLHRFTEKAAHFEHNQKLNVFQRATLGSAIKDNLLSLGWTPRDTELFVRALITYRLTLTLKQKNPP